MDLAAAEAPTSAAGWGGGVVIALYSVTFLFGLTGNVWVLSSMWRSRQLNAPVAAKGSPSNRLRTYIGLLAFVDMLVTLSLLFRLILVVHPQEAALDSLRCQSIHVMDKWVKAASLGCLACISLERYVTIRKPFSSATRKRLITLAPLTVLFVLLLSMVAMLVQAWDLDDIESGLNCGVPAPSSLDGPLGGIGIGIGVGIGGVGVASVSFDVTSWLLACIFLALLTTITVNYAQIVRHVKRKFWKRKCHSYEHQLRRLSVALLAPSRGGSECRGGASSSTAKKDKAQVKAKLSSKLIPLPPSPTPSSTAARRKLTPLPEPRYMRDMTAIIVRIAVFHAVCWLPHCLMQLMPYRLAADGSGALKSASTSVRFVELSGQHRHHDDGGIDDGAEPYYAGEESWLNWVELLADWLTYVNSAGDWILYAAMNRELRSLIKANSERRKRSAFSPDQNSPNMLRSSLQKQVTMSLRLFYSTSSFRTSAGATPRPNSRATPKASLSPSLRRGSSRGSKGSAGDGEQHHSLLPKKSSCDIGPFNGGWWTSGGITRGRNSDSSETKSVFNYGVVPPATPVNEASTVPTARDDILV